MPLTFLDYFPGAYAQLAHWMNADRITALETVYSGIENAAKAFTGLFRGDNVGKMILHMAD